MIHRIDPLTRLGSRLLEVEKPARYTGGEYGIYAKEGTLRTVIVFPDLYELGMSNQALRIIYNGLNRMDGISCDRAFAPAPDFEKLLKEEGLPLYGLDTGIALGDADLLLFTLGYELGITGLLSVLDSSRIALRSSQRGKGDPIVIMGGPCVSNPLPYSPFIDAFWIGEAEAGFFDLAGKLLEQKKAGASRKDLFESIAGHPHIWTRGKTGVRRAVEAGFGKERREAAVFPVPNIKTVQHHGAVEIMRGCPNGCRFCYAGMWYRPMRQKRADLIMEEAEAFIMKGGWREISLSSLSSGDYCNITGLTAALNSRYGKRHISFQLPSLRVSGFSLPLLASISEVRKGGLTFAVETPAAADQLAINKEAALAEVISIIREAKKHGWRGAKFYFMIGLPLANPETRLTPSCIIEKHLPEEQEIVDFILEAGKAAASHFNVNVGTFIPKPHTPYQRCAQLDEEAAWGKLAYIRDKLPRGHKVSVHNPFISLLEGVIARGTEDAGLLAETAYNQGCRLDAWAEHIQTGVWRKILSENAGTVRESIAERNAGETLPWSVIQSRVGEVYLDEERRRSGLAQTTTPCLPNCTHPCGVCGKDMGIVSNSAQVVEQAVEKQAIEQSVDGQNQIHEQTVNPVRRMPDSETYRILFSFVKKDTAVFIPHLGVIEIFSAAVIRSGLPAVYTQGFNPLLKTDFAAPAPVGLHCNAEIASMDMEEPVTPGEFVSRLNAVLPAGFTVSIAELFVIPAGEKKHSVSSVLWGFRYGENKVPAKEEKKYRESCEKALFDLARDEIFAKNPKTGGPVDYFTLYNAYYKGFL
ncbi:MAG: TIGR03936 family radical SAM-associated protein [Spirochaetaceae bacterium]|jgi:radical SAM-linked protein|nr:TIGR03936 family radical SAM-associated protein [Spirochaetaceae bacterium]